MKLQLQYRSYVLPVVAFRRTVCRNSVTSKASNFRFSLLTLVENVTTINYGIGVPFLTCILATILHSLPRYK